MSGKPLLSVTTPCCAEPHHAHGADPKAHRWHHWKERFKCAGFCLSLHVIYEVAVHVLH